MSKKSLALVSLTAAIPALALTLLLAKSLLSSFGSMPGAMVGLVGLTLLASAFTSVLPVGIVLFGPKGEATAKAPKPPKEKKGKKGKEDVEEAAVAAVSDEVDILSSDEIPAEEELAAADDDFEVDAMNTEMSTNELDVVEGAFTEDNLPSFRGAESNAEIDEFSDDDFGIEVEEED